MASVHSLAAWERAHRFALAVCAVSASFPRTESDGITAYLRRAALAIPASLAESYGWEDEGADLRVVRALGAVGRAEHHLALARERGYLSARECAMLQKEVRALRDMVVALRGAVVGEC